MLRPVILGSREEDRARSRGVRLPHCTEDDGARIPVSAIRLVGLDVLDVRDVPVDGERRVCDWDAADSDTEVPRGDGRLDATIELDELLRRLGVCSTALTNEHLMGKCVLPGRQLDDFDRTFSSPLPLAVMRHEEEASGERQPQRGDPPHSRRTSAWSSNTVLR